MGTGRNRGISADPPGTAGAASHRGDRRRDAEVGDRQSRQAEAAAVKKPVKSATDELVEASRRLIEMSRTLRDFGRTSDRGVRGGHRRLSPDTG
jgi:hypothetical protein